MKIAILHQDLEIPEKNLLKVFRQKGHQAELFDVRITKPDVLQNCDVVLNRVYASVGNRNWQDNVVTLNLLEQMEKKGVKCINSFMTSKVDYSKAYAAQIMKTAGVKTPETIKLTSYHDLPEAVDFATKKGFPVILKRDLGGRSKDLFMLHDRAELLEKMQFVFAEHYRRDYDAGFVLQEFVKPVKEYDCRIAIVNGEFAFAFARTLARTKHDGMAWLASVARGSQSMEYNPSHEEIELAKKATEAIGAIWNEVDITFSENGPVIIENNPTPNFVSYAEERIKKAADLVLQQSCIVEVEK